jgi:hypothetical protein
MAKFCFSNISIRNFFTTKHYDNHATSSGSPRYWFPLTTLLVPLHPEVGDPGVNVTDPKILCRFITQHMTLNTRE